MYGRGANALAREINKVVKDPVTVETCQQIIANIAKSFPVAWKWLHDNAEFAVENGWISNVFGRRRYFTGIQHLPESEQMRVRREAKNSPIQGCLQLLEDAVYTDDGWQYFPELVMETRKVVTPTFSASYRAFDSGVKDTVCVVLGNGASFAATPDHKLAVYTQTGTIFKSAGELVDGDLLVWQPMPPPEKLQRISYHTCYDGARVKHNRSLDLELDEEMGWIMGFTLGNGCMTCSTTNGVSFVTSGDTPEVLEPIRSFCKRTDIHLIERLNRNRLLAYVGHGVFKGWLETAGLEPVTHDRIIVPASIRNSPRAVQLAFLDGYLSADGTVNPEGSVTWVSKSVKFVRSLANMLANLGIISSWFIDGAGFARAGIPRSEVENVLKEYPLFKHHAVRRNWLTERTAGSQKVGAIKGMSLPNWLVRPLMPEVAPNQKKFASANVIVNRVKRGAHLNLRTLTELLPHGAKLPRTPVMPVKHVIPYGMQPVADLSILTENQDERQFIVNGVVAHNCVGDLALQAGINFYRFQYRTKAGKKLDFKVVLPVHDAYYFEVKDEHVETFKKVIEMCMSKMNRIPNTDKYLGVDTAVMKHSLGDKH